MAAKGQGRFVSLVGSNPVLFGAEWVRQQGEKHLKAGASGLKVSAAAAYPGDDRMAVVWEEAHRRKLPVLSMATGRGSPGYQHPRHFEEVLRGYKDCRIAMAHVGMGPRRRLANHYPDLCCDTSLWLARLGEPGFLTLREAAEIPCATRRTRCGSCWRWGSRRRSTGSCSGRTSTACTEAAQP